MRQRKRFNPIRAFFDIVATIVGGIVLLIVSFINWLFDSA